MTIIATSSKFKNILPVSSNQLIDLLNINNIEYKLYEHIPLFSVKESKFYQKTIFPNDKNSCHIKNLYLRDKKKK